MKLVAGAASDVGRVRDGNEDSFLVDDRLALYAVADGMGGHRGGEIASSTSLEALRAAVAGGEQIRGAVRSANKAVFDSAASDPELEGMGTTLTTVLALGGSTLLIGHVGDSRAYAVVDGELRQITDDHSLVEELVREGRLTREQAEAHPQRSIITRALGVEPEVDVDLFTLTVHAGDRVILCSDGLTTMLRDREIAQILRQEADPRVVADRLVDAANEAGGEDNITVLVLDILEAEPDPAIDVAALEALSEPTSSHDQRQSADDTPGDGDSTGAPTGDSDELIPETLVEKRSRGRRVAGWSLVVVPILLVAAIAIVALGWYARSSYYVGLDGTDVVIYKGVPGGVLGWDPTVEEPTGLTVEDLSEVDRADLEDGAARGSRSGAEAYVTRLIERVEAAEAASTTTAPITTSTTPARSSTTTPRSTTTARDSTSTTTAGSAASGAG